MRRPILHFANSQTQVINVGFNVESYSHSFYYRIIIQQSDFLTKI